MDEDDYDIFKKKKIPKGFKKVGLDTSILVHLFHYKINLQQFKNEKLPEKSLFYYANRTKNEFIGVLINKEDCTEPEALSAWGLFVDTFDLKRILWDKNIEKEYVPAIKEINENIAKKRDTGFTQSYKIGNADIEIIANFLKEKMDVVYTSDRAFHETCKALNLYSVLIQLHRFLENKK